MSELKRLRTVAVSAPEAGTDTAVKTVEIGLTGVTHLKVSLVIEIDLYGIN